MRREFSQVARWLLVAAITSRAVDAADEPDRLRGELRIHDPSTIIRCDTNFWVFGTGFGVRSKFSPDLVSWQAGPAVFKNPPAWTVEAVPNNRGSFWAPDVIRVGNRFLLYYSVSTWGSRHSAIGLATTPTLNPAALDFHWTDCGPVIQSRTNDNFNTIDPSVLLDSSGRLWLSFGSYWSGIKLVELDPATGLRRDTNAPVVSLAWNESIEASCLCQHRDFFYLFVNWGQCCRGTNSTYEIRFGRSAKVTGPYLDQNGADLMERGGTLFLSSSGHRIGPGHAGILREGGKEWFSYHFYDANARGNSMFDLRPLRWTTNGWPELAPADGPE